MKRFRRTQEEMALSLTPRQAKARRAREKKAVPSPSPSYTDISYEDLGDWVGRKTMIKVSKEWLNKLIKKNSPEPSIPFLGANLLQKPEETKIEFKLTDLNDS